MKTHRWATWHDFWQGRKVHCVGTIRNRDGKRAVNNTFASEGEARRFLRGRNKVNKALSVRDRQAFPDAFWTAGGDLEYRKAFRDGSYEDHITGRLKQGGQNWKQEQAFRAGV